MNDYDDPLAMPWLHIKPKAPATTPDPTTRDPAASLRACIELASEAHRRGIEGGDWASASRDANLAAANFIRDDAPALLAEVERLRHDTAERDAFDTRHVAMTMAEYTEFKLAREAAEQVAREAVALLRRIRANGFDGPIYRATMAPDACDIDAFLKTHPHHGARTGDANE